MQLLSGVRVLDLSRILAGPHAAQSLADLGAEVLKLEAPWGDDTRSWGPPFQPGFDGENVASYFLSCNRGKRIESVNIKTEQARIQALVRDVDVVIENFKPGTFEAIVADVPDNVIVCSISGYGQNGPRRNEVAFDLTMQARSGIMSITGDAEGAPAKVGVAWIDVMTGMNAVSSILAALYHREKTGKGARIDISLWDTALASLVNQGHNALTGITPGRMGSAHPNLVPYRGLRGQRRVVRHRRRDGKSVAQTRGGAGFGRARALEGQQRSHRRASSGGSHRTDGGCKAEPSRPGRFADGDSMCTGEHGERGAGRRTDRSARWVG